MTPPPLPWTLRTQAERTILLCSAAAVFAGALVLLLAAQGVIHLRCTWHAVTGMPCPGCGTTRLLLCLARGEWFEALAMNPGAAMGLLALAVLNIYAAGVVLLRIEPWRPALAWSGWRWMVAAALAANWVYLLAAGRV